MVDTIKFSEFAVANLDANNTYAGLSDGGNALFNLPLSWTTAGRPATPTSGLLGYNTTLAQYEFFDGITWQQLEDSGDINDILAMLASHDAGKGASLIGLQNQGAVVNKTVQDLANAGFIVKTDNGSLVNAQVMGVLTTGIVKNTFITGVQTISGPCTSIDGLTTVANNLLYTTAPGIYNVIAPVNSALFISSAAGVPSWSNTAIPAYTMAGNIDMDGFKVTNAADPTDPQDYATKFYVDQNALSGTSVYAATIDGTMNATQAGAGIGATLTDASGTFAPLTLDGEAIPLNADVLIKNTGTGVAAENEGIYKLTTNGDSVSIPWQLTRSVEYDTPDQINNTGLIVVQNGATIAGTAWYNAATIVTVDTTAFDFVLFGTGGTVTSISAGTGITATPDPIIETGTIAVSGALADIVNNVIGPNKNLIIGGNFDTNPWQRGTTFTGTTNGAYTADRFQWNFVGAGVIDTLKTADAPTVAEAGIFTSNCYNVDVTTADAAIAAADTYRVTYRMEGYDWAQIAQRVFTISFWVKSTVTGIYSISFGNNVDRTYVAEYTVNVSDTWEKKTITVSASPSAGTWLYTTGLGLIINWTVAAGTNFQTSSLNTWNSDVLRASTNQVNGMDNAANFFKLALIQVEAGNNATGFQIRSEVEELVLCQRYYEKTFNVSVAPAQNAGSGGAIGYYRSTAGAVLSYTSWQYKVRKRVAATLVFYNPNAANTNWRNFTSATDSGASTFAGNGEANVVLQNNGAAGDGANSGYYIHLTSDAEL